MTNILYEGKPTVETYRQLARPQLSKHLELHRWPSGLRRRGFSPLRTRRARPTQFHVEHVVCPAYHDVAHVHALRARALDFLHPSAKEGVM